MGPARHDNLLRFKISIYLSRPCSTGRDDDLSAIRFTRTTGEAHWEVLLRARAIECGAYVFTPAQCGVHTGDRKTYGHSLIIDPWGRVLVDGGEEPGYILADITPGYVDEVWRSLPSLQHDRDYIKPTI